MIRIIQGDCREVLRALPDASVHCCVTSPPYFGLRDYQTGTWSGGDTTCDHRVILGVNGATSAKQVTSGGTQGYQYRDTCGKCSARRIDAQIGLEASPDAYIAEMVAVFREVRRVLRDDGTLWLNLGDSMSSGGNGPSSGKQLTNVGANMPPKRTEGLAAKQLLMMPARVALALQADGWWLRSDIIWAKPNPMPESVTDRPTSAHEHVFLLTKAPRYYFDADAVREDCESGPSDIRKMEQSLARIGGKHKTLDDPLSKASAATNIGQKRSVGDPSGRNIRNVWTIATAPFPDAHFATFPPELAERCIKAGTSERGCCANCGAPWVRQTETRYVKGPKGCNVGVIDARDHAADRNDQASNRQKDGHVPGWNRADITLGWIASCACNAGTVPATVLDCFAGAFTAPLVADRLQRNAIGIELSEEYCRMARARLLQDAGMFAEVAAE